MSVTAIGSGASDSVRNPAGLGPAPAGGPMGAKEAASAVEGIFVSMLVSEMRKTLHGGGFFGEGPGSEIFDGMFDRLMGEEIAKKGGFGLAAFVEGSLKERQEEDQAAKARTELERTGAMPRLPS